jgi:hypothetical protein
MGEPLRKAAEGLIIGEGPYILGHDADTGLPVDVPVTALPEEPVHVPLVVYVGDEKKVIGDAVVKGDQISAFIEPAVGECLEKLLEHGVIQNISVTFNAPPSVPILRDGTIRWVKSY